MRLLQPKHPNNPLAQRSLIVDMLLDLEEQQCQDGVGEILGMLEELYHAEKPGQCRFAVSMKHTVLWELKSETRGGRRGGARVYWFPTEHNEAVICACEVKEGDAPNQALLALALRLYKQYEDGTIRF